MSGKWKPCGTRRRRRSRRWRPPATGWPRPAACGPGNCSSTWARSSLQQSVGLGQVLAVGALALVEVGHGVEPHAVDAHVEPEVHHLEHRLAHRRLVEVQVRLVGVEAVPVVGAGHRVPGPVRGFEVLEDDARLAVALGRVAPDVEVARQRARRRAAGALEPGVLVGGVVDHQLGDHPQAAAVRLAQEAPEVAAGAVGGMDVGVVGDVVAVVAQRRGVERQQPEGGDAEVRQVVELAGQARGSRRCRRRWRRAKARTCS